MKVYDDARSAAAVLLAMGITGQESKKYTFPLRKKPFAGGVAAIQNVRNLDDRLRDDLTAG